MTVFGAAKAAWMFCISAPPAPQAWVAIFRPRDSNSSAMRRNSPSPPQNAASGWAMSKASSSAKTRHSGTPVRVSPPAIGTLVAPRSSP